MIRHSGGLRKARMKLPGVAEVRVRGDLPLVANAQRFVLFMLYTKAKQTDSRPRFRTFADGCQTIKAKSNG